MLKFFDKANSELVKSGAPTTKEALLAMAADEYWTILNCRLLSVTAIQRDETLRKNVNAQKLALQVFGPKHTQLPDCRINTGSDIHGQVYHGHVKNNNGTTYIMEWAIVDAERKIMAITCFNTHENFNFMKKPLTNDQKTKVLEDTLNQKTIENVSIKIQEGKDKVQRIDHNYRHQIDLENRSSLK